MSAFATLLRASLPWALALAAAPGIQASTTTPVARFEPVVAKAWMIDATTGTASGHGGIAGRNPITGDGASAPSC